MNKFKLTPDLIAPPKFSAKAEMAMCKSSIIHLICPRYRCRDFIVLNFVGRKAMELNMDFFDTIAAIATPVGNGGIAIIRVSGEDAEIISQKVVRGRKLAELETHKLTLSKIHYYDNPTKIIDEALVSVMRAPNSYTGETVVEINCHGGFLVARVILEQLVLGGARIAEAGEFTRRAFINGKTDLAKAEATIDIINSNSKLGLQNAANSLTGKLSEKINKCRENAIALAANVSAIADFPDEIEDIDLSEFETKLNDIKYEINSLINSFNTGRILKEGIYTVIVGRPNVGKSSILNALAKEDRAIVTDIPGTTRDIIEEYINMHGVSLRLLDTAGIRTGADEVEEIGIQRAKENVAIADLCLFVVDTYDEITKQDLQIAKELKDKNVILILNKSDRLESVDVQKYSGVFGISDKDIVVTSTPKDAEPSGIDKLEELISSKFIRGEISENDVYITSERQRESLVRANSALDRLFEGLKLGMPNDLLYVDLEDVISALGEVIGETIQEEIIEQVFSRFCVGK